MTYDESYYEQNDQAGDRPALRLYAAMADRALGRPSTVYEFGAGHGYLSRRLSARHRTVASDVSPFARERITEVSPTTEVVTEPSEVASGSCDGVVALHVLEHLERPQEALAEFARIVRTGGVLLVVVPNPDGWGHRLKRERWFAYRDPTHISLLPQARWLQLIDEAGFEAGRPTSDGLWDPPYVGRVPRVLQLPVFGAGAALSVLLRRTFLPSRWGECLVVVARRRP